MTEYVVWVTSHNTKTGWNLGAASPELVRSFLDGVLDKWDTPIQDLWVEQRPHSLEPFPVPRLSGQCIYREANGHAALDSPGGR